MTEDILGQGLGRMLLGLLNPSDLSSRCDHSKNNTNHTCTRAGAEMR
jgi:hypothetical protein